MKATLSTSQVADRLFSDKENNGFSYGGCRALAEWLEQYEEDCGEEIELDVVAIRCDFSEYANPIEWADDYWGDLAKAMNGMNIEPETSLEDDEKAILEYLYENTLVVEFDGGIIVQAF